MRDIKFRAWDRHKKIMYSHDDLVDMDMEEELNYCTLLRGFYSEIKPMQYTGLKDKKLVEIYDGDILQEANGSPGYFEVVWLNGGFQKKYKYMVKYEGSEWQETSHSTIHNKSYVVVGNIYENANLLD